MRTIVSLLLCLFVVGAVRADSAERIRLGGQISLGLEQGNLFGSGPSSETQLLMFQPQLAVAIILRSGEPRLEVVNEVTLAESFRPARRFIVAVNEGFRFHVHPTRPVGGYLELGAGIGSSALHMDPNDRRPREDQSFRQLNGWMQYHLQVGAGVRINVGASRVQLGYRLTHFSNNRTTLPNLGLNMNTLVVSWQSPTF